MNVDTQSIYQELGLAPKAAERRKALGQDDFLRLMTEQLKNQDPLKPLESNEFLGQMAQFSSVQGIQQLNASFQALVGSVQNDQALQGASLVGHSVLVPSSSFVHAEAGVAGEFEVPMAGSVSFEIADASGAIVQRGSVQAGGPGSVAFRWDGRLPDGELAPPGTYTIAARVSAGRTTEAVTPQVSARIDSVSLTQQGLILNLDGIGPKPLSAVRRIGG